MIMFKVGDVVQHKVTKIVGRIFGYGCRLSGNVHFMTLKVKPLKKNYFRAEIEGVMDEWQNIHCDDSPSPPPKARLLSLAA
jgi:hypothetical protein